METTEREQVQRWMTRLADGDRTAFEPLYEALWPVVRRFTERALQGSADGEDAAQAALLKVFARCAEFDPARDALSWVLGIAAYEVKTLRQRSRRRREAPMAIEELSSIRDGGASPEESAASRELEAAAIDAIGMLRPSDVETLRLVASGERPDVDGATFRKRVERAIVRVRAAWRSKYGTE